MTPEPPGFREYVEARSPALLRTAWMLTGDAAAAEDLLQATLAKVWPHWARVADGHPDAYVRKAMLRTHLTWRARLWHRERPTDLTTYDVAAAGPGDGSGTGVTEDRMVLTAALAGLPARQRQAVVLRYFEDLSVETVAELMGSTTGTVKSQSAKGLAKLRAALEAQGTFVEGRR